ncbi:MAG: right-handed parallel beta-helix repeat-containing protein [Deltaproteobacteria bacterium]|nr:right-handed parallel beta-helix repeat-containing protein [Deltaproteobacteria bacterium]
MIRIIVAFALVAGCKETNPLFCEGHPDDPRCTTDGSIVACTSNADCFAPTPVCDAPGTMMCVECTSDQTDACTGTSPVCGDDLACRGCAAHVECPASDACLPDGACANEADVAYVDPTGGGTACTLASPCSEVSAALATTRAVLKLTGITNEQVTLDNRNVTILADPGAKLTDTSNGILLKIDGTSQVSIYDLEISGASGLGIPGISLQLGNASDVLLTRVKVDANQGGGISSSGGTLTVTQSTLSGNQGGGISVSAGATFTITNNFVFRNGDQDTGTFGGINLGVASAGLSRLEFNTIVDNRASSGATRAGGVICDIVGFSAANNLVARNSVGGNSSAANAQTLGVCSYPTSTIQSDVAGLSFASPDTNPFDYHVMVGSSVIEQATTVSNIVIDVDGDSRPQGAASDIGADEFAP